MRWWLGDQRDSLTEWTLVQFRPLVVLTSTTRGTIKTKHGFIIVNLLIQPVSWIRSVFYKLNLNNYPLWLIIFFKVVSKNVLWPECTVWPTYTHPKARKVTVKVNSLLYMDYLLPVKCRGLCVALLFCTKDSHTTQSCPLNAHSHTEAKSSEYRGFYPR